MECLVNYEGGCDESSGESGSRYLQNCYNLVAFEFFFSLGREKVVQGIAREIPTEGCSTVAQNCLFQHSHAGT